MWKLRKGRRRLTQWYHALHCLQVLLGPSPMALTPASTIFHTVPLKPFSDAFPTHFWSLRTVASMASSVVVHLALARCFLGWFEGVVASGEARRVEGRLWEFSE